MFLRKAALAENSILVKNLIVKNADGEKRALQTTALST